jgi:glycine/D-amino acid oxidase-like deaminating enzyme
MVKSNSKAKTVAVLGSGIIGLFSALECANMGMTVTVYADRVPQAN